MICGGEPGGEETLQSEWEQKFRNEDFKRLSGEPYQVYTYGIGWHDADTGHAAALPRPQRPAVQAEELRADHRAAVHHKPGPCGGDHLG